MTGPTLRKYGLTVDQWVVICGRFGGRCAACRCDGALSVDHIQPRAAGGTDHHSNIQPLCRKCNARKNAREIDFSATGATFDSPWLGAKVGRPKIKGPRQQLRLRAETRLIAECLSKKTGRDMTDLFEEAIIQKAAREHPDCIPDGVKVPTDVAPSGASATSDSREPYNAGSCGSGEGSTDR